MLQRLLIQLFIMTLISLMWAKLEWSHCESVVASTINFVLVLLVDRQRSRNGRRLTVAPIFVIHDIKKLKIAVLGI